MRQWLLSTVLLAAMALVTAPAQAVTARDYTIAVTATTSATAPYVTLNWPAAGGTALALYVRAKGGTSWGSSITLAASATSYPDPNAQPGVVYEYSLQASGVPSVGSAIGAVAAGYNIPLVEQRGNVILLVDNTMSAPLAPEITRLVQNLTADGWTVYRHDVPRQSVNPATTGTSVGPARLAELQNIRSLLQTDYNRAPAQNWALMILGHVPVPYSGNTAFDGHTEHAGAWPTDLYYADVDGTWTDTTVNSSTANDTRNRNVPGDAKFDATVSTTTSKLATGRVDLANMTNVPTGMTETQLLRQYLVRDHNFRRNLAPYTTVARRGIVDDNFYHGITDIGWNNGYAMFGGSAGQMDALDYFTTLQTTPMLFAYGCGGGSNTSASGVGNSVIDFGHKDVKAVFHTLFGSWFGDWDCADNFLRAPLAGTPNSLGLCDAWNGLLLYHMTLGDTIGACTRFSQNNTPAYGVGWQSAGYGSHYSETVINLMGDPTLRLHSVTPPTKVTASSASGGITLNWTASPDAAVSGYHVYRASTASGPFTRLTGAATSASNATGTPLAKTVTSYTDADPTLVALTTYTYLVKAVKVETTAAGTYANQSVGEAATLTHLLATPAPPAPTRLVVTRTGNQTVSLTWDDNATNETGYRVQRCNPADNSWQNAQILGADTTTTTDTTALLAGQNVYYRVYANGTPPSGYSNEATDYGLFGLISSDDNSYVVEKTSGALTYNYPSNLQNINLGLTNNASGYDPNGWNQVWLRLDGATSITSLPINNLQVGAQAPYSFDSLTNGALSAGTAPTAVGNQDGWYLDNAIATSIVQVSDGTGSPAPGKVIASPVGGSGRALRVCGDLFAGTEQAAVMQYDFQLLNTAGGNQFALAGNGSTGGFDSNSPNRFGPKFLVVGGNGSAVFSIMPKTTGGAYASAISQTVTGLTVGHWYQVRLVMDFTANAGNGSGSLSYRDLTMDLFAPTASRLMGSACDVAATFTTSDFLSSAGVDYTATTGTVAWTHGQTGSKAITAIPLLTRPSPQLTKIVKVSYSAPTNGAALGNPSVTYGFITDPVAKSLPSPWATTTFGTISPGKEGYAEQAGGTFGIAALSQTIRNGLTSDAGRFLYLPITGDCQLTARLTYMPTALSNKNVESGIMIRGGLDAGAVTSMLIQPHWITMNRGVRTSVNAALSTAPLTTTINYGDFAAPVWMRLTRTGNTISISQSPDGATWTLANADVTLTALPATAYVGLVLSTEGAGYTPVGPLNYVRYDNVTAYTIPGTTAGLSAAAAGTASGQITLNWTATFGAASYLIERSNTPGGGFVQINQVAATTCTDSGLTAGQTYYYRVKATSPLGTAASYSAEAAAAPYLAPALAGWRYRYFGSESNTGDAADAADPNGNGASNLLEYAFGTDPKAASSTLAAEAGGVLVSRGLPTPRITTTATLVDYRGLFCRRKDRATSGLVYTPQFSHDLGSWLNSTDIPSVLADDGEIEVVAVPFPFFLPSGLKARFFRVSVVAP